MKNMLETLRSYAEAGKYKRVPVSRELYADAFTPVEVTRTLRAASRHCYLLESAEDKQRWGRYSFLGYAPTMEITCTDGHVTITEGAEEEEKNRREFDTDHPGEVLREILKDYKSPVMEGMPPFTGGLVGYFSYEYIKYAEPSLKGVLEPEKCRDGQDAGSGREFRDMDLMLFDKVIVFDNYRQKLILITGVSLEGDLKENYGNALKELDDMERLIKSGAKADFRPLELEEPKPEADKETYCQMVEKAKEYIRDGDIFQVVLSNPMTAKAKEEDRRLEKELLRDEKELAEHNMLVDLGRNDIGKISRPGTVHVEKYMEIQRFSHVMHIGSTVSGEIRPDKDGVDVIDAILPAGTLSGAPKIRACEIIAELEQSKRGIYGGAVGYLDFTGNIDTCISIRLAYKKNGRICVQSGAGIVADSVPENEFNECRNKAGAVTGALHMAKGGLA